MAVASSRDKPVEVCATTAHNMTFASLLTEHVASSLAKQFALDEYLGQHNWRLDLHEGTVDFGSGRVYPVQILGTESKSRLTWRWAWAHYHSRLPPRLLTCAARTRSLGLRHDINELTEPELPLDRANGHTLSIVASGICGADAYYRGPCEDGAVFFLVYQIPLDRRPTPPPGIAKVISTVISQYEVDHRRMASRYLQQEGFDLTEADRELRAVAPDGSVIAIGFDERGRIAAIRLATSRAREADKDGA